MHVSAYDLSRSASMFVAAYQAGDLTDEEFSVNLATFLDAADDKIAALRAVVIRLEADAALLKSEAALFTERRKRAESAAERCTESAAGLLRAMRDAGQAPVVEGVARLQTNGGKVPVIVEDEAAVPVAYRRAVVPPPDLDRIRAALESGAAVPGCRLGERGEGVRWARGGAA